jgi:NADPH:quinone reductase-like Zn-dependent oxidoreductase
MKIPETSQAVLLRAYGDQPALEVVERSTPRPGTGQVLVRIAAAPINPSDLGFVRGTYGIHKSLPVVPGIEGSGTVVAAGKGFLARRLLGRRVACSGLSSGDGTWAEYALLDANRCVPLNQNISDEQAACLFVNPWTAIALTQIARKGRHSAIVLTAGASQLSRMMLRLAQQRGITTVHLVRTAEQVQVLKRLGAKFVVNSSEPNFATQLAECCDRIKATIAFDAVAGEMTQQLVQAMPSSSRVIVYGGLSEQSCQVPVGDLLFKSATIEGFWLTHWLAGKNLLQLLSLGKQAQRFLSRDFKTEIRDRLPLHQISRALELAASGTTAGKILLVPRA